MNSRELFQRIMHFEPVDRVPLWLVEEITPQAERKWCRDEKLPYDRTGQSILEFDAPLITCPLGDQPPIPTFVPKVIANDGEYVTTQDVFGFLVKKPVHSYISPIRYIYVGAPLQTIEDWRKMATRFDPTDARRFPIHWSEDYLEHMSRHSAPVTLGMNWGPARGIKNGYMFGFNRLMELLVSEPEVLEEVFSFWAEFMVSFLGRFIDRMPLDAFLFKEDGMGFRNSTLVSPAMFRSIYQPHMRKVTDFLRSHGVDIIGYYSSGNLRPLLPLLLDTGINLITPVEAAAGMDAIALGREYPELRMIGNIARQAIMDGPQAIDLEVDRKVPALMARGGFIPAFDDAVMPDMTFEDVQYCADRIRAATR